MEGTKYHTVARTAIVVLLNQNFLGNQLWGLMFFLFSFEGRANVLSFFFRRKHDIIGCTQVAAFLKRELLVDLLLFTAWILQDYKETDIQQKCWITFIIYVSHCVGLQECNSLLNMGFSNYNFRLSKKMYQLIIQAYGKQSQEIRPQFM